MVTLQTEPTISTHFTTSTVIQFPAKMSSSDASIARFILCQHGDSIREILLYPDSILHCSLLINFAELLDSDTQFGHEHFYRPANLLPLFDHATKIAQELEKEGSLNDFIHVRVDVCGSPLECPETFPSIGRVRVRHRGILLTLKGTVIRSGTIKMTEGEWAYECRK